MRKLVVVVVVAVLCLPTAGAVFAQEQHQNANVYALWNYEDNTGFRDVAQLVKIRKKASHTFWAQFWRWVGSDVGGYVGLQTDGVRFDGSRGEMLIFSLWEGDAARGQSCGTFGGEGEGYSCRLPFRIRTKHVYQLEVKRLPADEVGRWWRAIVRDRTADKNYRIGDIRVDATHTLMGEPMNFSEYFGPAVECDAVPLSVALWDAPRANKLKRGYRYSASRGSSSRGACTGGGVEAHHFGQDGVKVTQGGPL